MAASAPSHVDLETAVEAALALSGKTGLQAALEVTIAAFKAESGSIHLLASDGLLHVQVTKGIPQVVLDKTGTIPVGKGMAGLAVLRSSPVTACNIQTDTSGDVQPGAKLTGLEGAVVVPILLEDKAVGALGIANREPRVFSSGETEALTAVGRLMAVHGRRALLKQVEEVLGEGKEGMLAALDLTIAAVGAESGSVHLLQEDGLLHLAASRDIPEEVLGKVLTIPVGKGMAGLTVQRNAAVTACNIQTDTSGDVQPGAKATRLEGAIVVPMVDGEGRAVGALGVGNRSERVFTELEQGLLREVGKVMVGL